MFFMRHKIYRIAKQVLPIQLKNQLRKQGWFQKTDLTVWKLPPPLTGYQMQGPGIFGTYVNKPYEPLIAKTILELTEKDWTLLDVGAHLGYFTILLAHSAGENGKVFAFEALSSNSEWLYKNLSLNGLINRVTVENLAVTDGNQSIVRLNKPQYYTNTWSIIRNSSVNDFVEVEAISLDKYFDNKSQINFLKMDIEGAEYLALQGMYELLKRDRPICLVELHQEEGQMAARFLKKIGYTLTDLNNNICNTSIFPSHIVARFE